MSTRTRGFEWKVLLADADWERQEPLDQLLYADYEQLARPHLPQRMVRLWVIALLLAGVGGWLHWHEGQVGAREIHGEVTSTLETEARSQQVNREMNGSMKVGAPAESAGELTVLPRYQTTVDRPTLLGQQGRFSMEAIVPISIGQGNKPQGLGQPRSTKFTVE